MGGTYIAYVMDEYVSGGEIYTGPDPFENDDIYWKEETELGHHFGGMVVFHGVASNSAEVLRCLTDAGYAEHTLVIKELL